LEQLWPDAMGWLLKAAALGAVFAVDGQAVLHLIAGQPLAVGALTGWALGDARMGILVGAYLQLVWAYDPPRGRIPGPDSASGTIIAVLVAKTFVPAVQNGEGHLALALCAGIGVAWLGGRGEVFRRSINTRVAEGALRRLRGGEAGALSVAHGAGVAVAAVRGGLTTFVGGGIGLLGGSVLINLFAGMDFGAAFALIPPLGLAIFLIGVVRAKRMELAGFAAGLAAALLMGLKFGIT
jgi:mannose/fructose/N-acetylgalactosamine-specific phosphotransferase system component IIC